MEEDSSFADPLLKLVDEIALLKDRVLKSLPGFKTIPFKLGELVLQWTADQVTLQDLHCDKRRGMKEWKLPSIPQRNRNTAGQVKEFAPVTSTTPRRRSLCVLPDLSKAGAEKRVRFGASTPLTKKHVEKVNSTFDSLESKSQDLVKWLRDQQ